MNQIGEFTNNDDGNYRLSMKKTDLAKLDLSLQVLDVLGLIVDNRNQVMNSRQTVTGFICGSLLDSKMSPYIRCLSTQECYN